MEIQLYPLQFNPTYHYRIWGGEGLKNHLNKPVIEENIGESWEVSTIPNYVSEVKNGRLQGLTIQKLIHNYKADFLGDFVIDKYGETFPLLLKYISTNAPLSVQVHPNDEYAQTHYNSFGKSEMWYIIEAEEQSEIIIGFKENIKPELYKKKLAEGKLEDILQKFYPKKGEVYYIPAGRVHAIGKGITLAEVQQASDLTFRIYDYNRKDKNGTTRTLHTQEALEVADFSKVKQARTLYNSTLNQWNSIIQNRFFSISKLSFNREILRTLSKDSFTLYMCTEGDFDFFFENSNYSVKKGETLCIPANITKHILVPKNNAEILSVRLERVN